MSYRDKELEPIFAGISGTGDKRGNDPLGSNKRGDKRSDAVSLRDVAGRIECSQSLFCIWALESNSRIVVPLILQHNGTISRKMTMHPLEIEIAAGTIDHQKIRQLSRPVDDEIINDPPTLIQHEGVLTPGNGKLSDAVG